MTSKQNVCRFPRPEQTQQVYNFSPYFVSIVISDHGYRWSSAHDLKFITVALLTAGITNVLQDLSLNKGTRRISINNTHTHMYQTVK